jgi:DNA-binding NarL/FixJ family response regulator
MAMHSREKGASALKQDIAELRLLVVDDHAAVRAGLRQLLSEQPGFRVLACKGDAESAVALAEQEAIDVAVVDYQLGGRDGLWVCRKLKRLPYPVRVVIYSGYHDELLAAAAVVAEADALLSKSVFASELCTAVRGVAAGQRRLPILRPWSADMLRSRWDHDEQAIFGMLLAGISQREIAGTLGLSAAGLETRLWAMLRDLQTLPTPSALDRRAAAQDVPV